MVLGLVVFIFALMVALIGGCTTFHKVDPGTVGVVLDYAAGNAANEPVLRTVPTAQWFMVNPITQRVVTYPIGQQTLSMVRKVQEGKVQGDDSIECRDSTGIPLHIDTTTQWRADPAQAAQLYLLRPNVPLAGSSGADIEDLVVRREVRNAVGTRACSLFTYVDIFGAKRADFQQKASDFLKEGLRGEFILVDAFQIGEIYPEAAQQDSLNNIAIAQQRAQAAQALEEQRKAEARAAVAQADGERLAAIARAQGEAEAIRLVQEQLNASPNYISYLYASRWNGQYPTTLVQGQAGGVLPNLPLR